MRFSLFFLLITGGLICNEIILATPHKNFGTSTPSLTSMGPVMVVGQNLLVPAPTTPPPPPEKTKTLTSSTTAKPSKKNESSPSPKPSSNVTTLYLPRNISKSVNSTGTVPPNKDIHILPVVAPPTSSPLIDSRSLSNSNPSVMTDNGIISISIGKFGNEIIQKTTVPSYLPKSEKSTSRPIMPAPTINNANNGETKKKDNFPPAITTIPSQGSKRNIKLSSTEASTSSTDGSTSSTSNEASTTSTSEASTSSTSEASTPSIEATSSTEATAQESPSTGLPSEVETNFIKTHLSQKSRTILFDEHNGSFTSMKTTTIKPDEDETKSMRKITEVIAGSLLVVLIFGSSCYWFIWHRGNKAREQKKLNRQIELEMDTYPRQYTRPVPVSLSAQSSRY